MGQKRRRKKILIKKQNESTRGVTLFDLSKPLIEVARGRASGFRI